MWVERKQSCAYRRGFMGFSREIWPPDCLSCNLCGALTLTKPSAGTQSRKSVSQPKLLLFWQSFIYFQSYYIPSCLVLLQGHPPLHNCINQGPTRKQKRSDYLKRRKFSAGNWPPVMEEAEKPTRAQIVNPETSHLRKLWPSLGRGKVKKGRRVFQNLGVTRRNLGTSLSKAEREGKKYPEFSPPFTIYLPLSKPAGGQLTLRAWETAFRSQPPAVQSRVGKG